MSKVRLYLDEDSCSHRFTVALRQAGFEVLSALELGRTEIDDDAQLEFAIDARCALITANKRDFAMLHAALARAGREHWGLIIRSEQANVPEAFAASIAELLRNRDAEALRNAIVFV